MKTKTIIIAAFVIVAIIQLAVPAKMIVDHERILISGKQYKFKIAPFDPSDPFRGKYMNIRIAENKCKVDSINGWKYNEDIYVIVKENMEDGCVKVINIARKKPLTGVDFIKAKVGNVNGNTVEIDYPFEQYYLDEFKASKAEQLYAEASKDKTKTSYIVVRAIDGNAVLSDLMINNKSIKGMK